ncbi:MAG TPA: UDP-3-O-(3-hydroxymyristoyl)glucosamine N-acyltransferase [Nostocaceae cyanobacterium]|nr:UDP-3-O-(3-hydroxymyristoyl)glucosamine N-acyltransferase [Nostocaceae cyanobacterium]
MKFSDIVNQLGDLVIEHSLTTHPNQDPEISEVTAIDESKSGTISYIDGGKFSALLETTEASAVILPNEEKFTSKATDRGMAWLTTSYPRLVFAKTIALFYQPYRPEPEIHPSAIIHPSVKLGKNVYIGAHVVIQHDVEIGDDVVIHPNVVIYPEVKIGDRTTLHANCTIQEHTSIGADCVIHCGAVIGGEGFGFVPTRNGWVKMEQSGYVVLEDRVEIGVNSTVDRPSVGETRIGRDTKIDNLVQIAHGCQVGANCAIAAQTGLAGGVTIGNGVILAGQVGIANQAKVGDRAVISAQSGILSDVPPGETVSGTPAMPHNIYLKASLIYRRLPEIYNAFKKIQRQLGLK